jgi:hypothetical protein
VIPGNGKLPFVLVLLVVVRVVVVVVVVEVGLLSLEAE